MRVARRFVVLGRVQGVGFRFFTEAAAAREGLSGSVRNLPDGGVEIEAEGETEAMGRFERTLWLGPPGARVDDIRIDELAPVHVHRGFRVRG